MIRSLFSIIWVLTSVLAYGATIDSVKVSENNDEVEVFLFTNASAYRDFVPDIPAQHPMIAIDLLNTRHNLPSTKISVMRGNLLAIRSSQYTRKITRIVLDVRHSTRYRIVKRNNGIAVYLSKSEVEHKQHKEIPVQHTTQFFYSSRGKRDPFKPLVSGKPKATELLDVEHATLIGIMWSPKERYALLQDKDGKGYILKEGDRVSRGRVLSIKKKEVIFKLYGFGEVKRVSLKIASKEQK